MWRRLLVIGREKSDLAARLRAGEPALEVTFRSLEEVQAEDLAGAEMLLAFRIPHRLRGDLGQLAWIQSFGAGVDGILALGGIAPNTVLTRVVGLFGERMAETVLCRCLALTQGLPRLFQDQAARRWHPFKTHLLRGLRGGVLGLGEIGSVVARRLADQGVIVTGVSRRGRKVAGLRTVVGVGDLPDLLRVTELLVCVLPATSATRGLLGERELALLPPGAFFINVGRGTLVDESALIARLADGSLGGAALDVFEEEPLPAHSPLWTLPNVLISPHMAAVTSSGEAAAAFLDNWRRIRDGQAPRGLVDQRSGY